MCDQRLLRRYPPGEAVAERLTEELWRLGEEEERGPDARPAVEDRTHLKAACASFQVTDLPTDEVDGAQTRFAQPVQAARFIDQHPVAPGPAAVCGRHRDGDRRLGPKTDLVSVLGIAVGVDRFNHQMGDILRRCRLDCRNRRVLLNGGSVVATIGRELADLDVAQAERGQLSDDRVGNVVRVDLVVPAHQPRT